MFFTRLGKFLSFSLKIKLSSANPFQFRRVQNLSFEKGLTHYLMTNFRLFQTEGVCRQKFQIWLKWQKAIQRGRKHCGKKRNCLLRAISFFPHCFQKVYFPGASKGVIVWEWVKAAKYNGDQSKVIVKDKKSLPYETNFHKISSIMSLC